MSSFRPAEQKAMCQGSKDPAENKEMPLPGLGGSWENLSSNTVPQTPASFPLRGMHTSAPPEDKQVTVGSVHASPGPDLPRPPGRPPAPAAPTLLATVAQGVPPDTAASPPRPRPRQRHAGQAGERPPRGLQVGPGRGQARPRQGSRWREAGAGPLVTYRRLMVPRRLRPAQALTDCARQPRLSLGSPAEIQERPFKRRRARGPPG